MPEATPVITPIAGDTVDWRNSQLNFSMSVARMALEIKTNLPQSRHMEALTVTTVEIAKRVTELEKVEHALAIVDALFGPATDEPNEFRAAIAAQIMGE